MFRGGGDFTAELWDAYDRNFNITEGVTLKRGESIPDGMFHLVCDIIVKHTDGTYLAMQRDFENSRGGLWEISAGGSAIKGETPLMCAERELREETGIAADSLKEIKRIADSSVHTLYVEYLCVTDRDKNSITLQKGETVDFKWICRESLFELVETASGRALEIIREFDI